MAWYPLRLAFELEPRNVVAVVGHQADTVQATLGKLFEGQPLSFAVQEKQRGTGDAVASAKKALGQFQGAVLVLYGDVPLLTATTVKKLIDAFRAGKGPLALISTRPSDPTGYGRLLRGKDGRVTAIVEEKDASPEQRAIAEINAGIYVADSNFLWEAIAKLEPRNAQGDGFDAIDDHGNPVNARSLVM